MEGYFFFDFLYWEADVQVLLELCFLASHYGVVPISCLCHRIRCSAVPVLVHPAVTHMDIETCAQIYGSSSGVAGVDFKDMALAYRVHRYDSYI